MDLQIFELFAQAKQFWLSNQFLSGAGTIAIVGGIAALGRKIPGKIGSWIKNRFVISVTIEENSGAFQYASRWFSDNKEFQKRTKDFILTSHWTDPDNCDLKSLYKTHPNMKALLKGGSKFFPRLVFSPGLGRHYLFYKRRLIIVTRNRLQANNGGGMSGGGNSTDAKHTFTFDIYSRKREILDHLFNDMVANDYLRNSQKTKVYVHVEKNWRELSCRIPRALDSVILQGDLSDEIYNDMKSFFESESWYRDKGVPYRRGYCFYGEPGTGKSSIVLALAGALKSDIAMLNLNDYAINDNNLSQIIAFAPAPIILFEDIDAAFKKRKKKLGPRKEETANQPEESSKLPSDDAASVDSGMGLSFSGFINALDGVAAQEGKIIVMTTNHLDKLDEAMIRPGRVDRKFYIGRATHDQMIKMFLRFFPEATEEAKAFAEALPERTINMATLQEHMMMHRHSSKEALDNVQEILKNIKAANVLDVGEAAG